MTDKKQELWEWLMKSRDEDIITFLDCSDGFRLRRTSNGDKLPRDYFLLKEKSNRKENEKLEHTDNYGYDSRATGQEPHRWQGIRPDAPPETPRLHTEARVSEPIATIRKFPRWSLNFR